MSTYEEMEKGRAAIEECVKVEHTIVSLDYNPKSEQFVIAQRGLFQMKGEEQINRQVKINEPICKGDVVIRRVSSWGGELKTFTSIIYTPTVVDLVKAFDQSIPVVEDRQHVFLEAIIFDTINQIVTFCAGS